MKYTPEKSVFLLWNLHTKERVFNMKYYTRKKGLSIFKITHEKILNNGSGNIQVSVSPVHLAEWNMAIFNGVEMIWFQIFLSVRKLYIPKRIGCLVVWVSWHINICRLLKAKSIFIQINLFYFKTIKFSMSRLLNCKKKHFNFKLFSLFKQF